MERLTGLVDELLAARRLVGIHGQLAADGAAELGGDLILCQRAAVFRSARSSNS